MYLTKERLIGTSRYRGGRMAASHKYTNQFEQHRATFQALITAEVVLNWHKAHETNACKNDDDRC